MNNSSLITDAARLQQAREKFDRQTGRPGASRTYQAEFDDLLKLFGDPDETLRSIGDKLGVSKERVRQIYRMYFCELFDGASARTRRRNNARQRKAQKAHDEVRMSARFELWRAVESQARKEGFKDIQGISTRCGTIKRRSIKIGNARCLLQKVRVAFEPNKGNGRFFSRVGIVAPRLKKHDFLVVYQKVEGFPIRFFVFPRTVLVAVFGEPDSWEKYVQDLYFPMEHYPRYRNAFSPRICVWKYEDAWHLLRFHERS